MRNSTATSGLPPAARRQALTSGSGNPIAVKLATASSGTSFAAGEGAEGVAAEGADPAGVAATDDDVVSAPGAMAGAVAGAGAGAGVAGTSPGAGAGAAAGFGSAFFFA